MTAHLPGSSGVRNYTQVSSWPVPDWMTWKWLGLHHTGLLLVYNTLQWLQETKQQITQKPNKINQQITIVSCFCCGGSAAHASQGGNWAEANHFRRATTFAPGMITFLADEIYKSWLSSQVVHLVLAREIPQGSSKSSSLTNSSAWIISHRLLCKEWS